MLLVCVWGGACRFYYFLFYVLHNYVDPELKSVGIADTVENGDLLVVREFGECGGVK